MGKVCSPAHVGRFDNFLRPLFHNCHTLFGPYLKPGNTVLDLGCGAGFTTMRLADLVGPEGRVTAVDLQPEMLGMVRQRLAGTELEQRVFLHQCSRNRIGVDQSFDFILAFWMVHEVPDQERFFTEINGCLKTDGVFYVVEPLFHVGQKDFKQMIQNARECGLETIERPRVRLSRAVIFRLESGQRRRSGSPPPG